MDDLLEPGEPPETVFEMKLARWRYVVAIVGMLFVVAFGVYTEWDMITHDPAVIRGRGRNNGDGNAIEIKLTGAARIVTIGLLGLIFFGSPCLTLAIIARGTTFAIRNDGIVFVGRKGRPVPWDQISDCHWNAYQPHMLNVHCTKGRVDVLIPKRSRPEVEAALRRFGKWRD